ncbi:MAG TPA: GntR family transcriptional regulator [Rhodanobacteraceae bacterium]|nr:GntR family transcriptional regulator [Rhodanobacteraceae bacterium]
MDHDLSREYTQGPEDRRMPAYLRLRGAIRRSVEGGGFAPGEPLPSERDLARDLKLSRVTVRKAIAGLVEDGLLNQRHGAGNFVADRIVKPFSRMSSFTEDLRARGLDPRSVVLDREIGVVTPDEAMALNLSPGQTVVRLHRQRFSGDTPLAVERAAIPHAILLDPASVQSSLYEALDAIGCRPVRALQRLRAVNLNTEQARQLNVPVGSAALALERRGFLVDGRVVEFTRSWYRADAYDFVSEMQDQ